MLRPNQPLYHATGTLFSAFTPSPTWFSQDPVEGFKMIVAQEGVRTAADSEHVARDVYVRAFVPTENIRLWRNHADHVATRERGKREWYEHFEVRVAKVERAYNGPRREA